MSTLKIHTLSNFAGTKSVPANTVIDGSAKAWVSFNGTGTIAIRSAFNVSSISDGGAGVYTVNFSVPMLDANYAVTVGALNQSTNSDTANNFSSITASSILVNHVESNVSADSSFMNVAIFR